MLLSVLLLRALVGVVVAASAVPPEEEWVGLFREGTEAREAVVARGDWLGRFGASGVTGVVGTDPRVGGRVPADLGVPPAAPAGGEVAIT